VETSRRSLSLVATTILVLLLASTSLAQEDTFSSEVTGDVAVTPAAAAAAVADSDEKVLRPM